MKVPALGFCIIFATCLYGQASSDKLQSNGSCSPPVKGNNNTVTINCKDDQEGRHIISLLKKVLSNQNNQQVLDKLDELLKRADEQVNNIECNGGNCALINNGTQNIIYMNTTKLPEISYTQEALEPYPSQDSNTHRKLPEIFHHPGAKVTIMLKDMFYNPIFLVKCNVPCALTEYAALNMGASAKDINPDDQTVSGAFFTYPSQMPPGSKVILTFRSMDDKNLSILNVRPYRPPSN